MTTVAATTLCTENGAKRRGRPARLSAEAVVQAALALLETSQGEDFTMGRVAQAVGTTAMALYRYFPSREALLEGMADHVFAQFVMPAEPQGRWQDTLLAWQWALKAHFERYQVLPRLMAWNGRLSGAWLKVQMPVIEALHQAGFRDAALVGAVRWFLGNTTGLLTIESADMLISFDGKGQGPGRPGNLDVAESLCHLNQPQRVMIEALLPYIGTVDSDAIVAFGFRHLIAGVETLLLQGGFGAPAPQS